MSSADADGFLPWNGETPIAGKYKITEESIGTIVDSSITFEYNAINIKKDITIGNSGVLKIAWYVYNHNTMTINEGGLLDVAAGGSVFNEGTIHQHGKITCSGENPYHFGSVNNCSQLTIYQNGTISLVEHGSLYGDGTLDNRGTINVGSEGHFAPCETANNSGTINVASGANLHMMGTSFENSGTISVENGGVLENMHSQLTVTSEGKIVIAEGGEFHIEGPLENSGTIMCSGAMMHGLIAKLSVTQTGKLIITPTGKLII